VLYFACSTEGPAVLSFDLFLISFKNGKPGKGDIQAARAVLQRHRYQEDDGYYNIEFEDKSELELFSSAPRDSAGGMIALRGSSDGIGQFIFEYAQAGGCAVIVAMEPPTALLPIDGIETHLPEEVRKNFQILRVNNGAEVLAAINGGYNGWKRYRDRVMSTQSEMKQESSEDSPPNTH
jgi:hypothetical protein